jgi:acyl dehydratase
MAKLRISKLAELDAWLGREVGVTDWLTIDQEKIDRFADATEDWQFIHVDPERARDTVFGGTIAHGFLTLSLLSKFAYESGIDIQGAIDAVNYGFDRVRLPSPVRANARVRCRFSLNRYQAKTPTRISLVYDVTVDIEHQGKPALVAEWLTLQELSDQAARAAVSE